MAATMASTMAASVARPSRTAPHKSRVMTRKVHRSLSRLAAVEGAASPTASMPPLETDANGVERLALQTDGW